MIATIILLFMTMVGLGIAIGKHGENQGQGKYNVLATLLSTIIQLVLYYYAGLFDKFFN